MPPGLFSAERPLKKEEPFREERRKMDPPGAPPRGGNPAHRSGPANRGVHHLHPQPGVMGPPGGRGGSGSHKDIKLTLLNKVNVAPVLPCRHGNGSRCGAESLYRLTRVLPLKSVLFCFFATTSGSSSRPTRAAGRGICLQTRTGLVPPPVRGWRSLQTEEVGAMEVAPAQRLQADWLCSCPLTRLNTGTLTPLFCF